MDYERIIAIAKQQKNFKKLEKSTHRATAQNSGCGDDVTIELLVENGLIEDAGFHGIGCALAFSSCSVVTEMVKKKKLEDAEKITKTEVLRELGMEKEKRIKKCALLGLEAFKKAVGKNEQ